MSAGLGPYEQDGILGEGGSAVVYAARGPEGEVALKVLRVDALTTDRQKKRFLDEAAHLARVRHPSLVEVLDSGTLPDGRPYLAMPRLEGETLAARLARGRLPVDEALALFEPIAGAVSALHEAGLVHRDLKAENIFLAKGTPIVLDLGIARESDASPSTTTEEGVVRGTPATMAPERFFGARATKASDVYELALILYAMLVGALPWNDASDVDARLSARPPRSVVGAIPRALSDAIMVALSTRPERRPASISALVESVRDAVLAGDEPRKTAAMPTLESGKTPGSSENAPASTARPPPPISRAPRSLRWMGAVAVVAIAAIGWRVTRAPAAVPPHDEAAMASPSVAASEGADSPTTTPAPPPAPPPTASVSATAPPLVASTDPIAPPSQPKLSSTSSPSAATSSDPVASCRKIAELYCTPVLVADALCAVSRNEVRAAEGAPADDKQLRGAICDHRLPAVAKEVKERLDRLKGQPTSHAGKISDQALDAQFPGCAHWRRTTCAHEGEHSLQCQNIATYIDTNFSGTPKQQKELRKMCSIDAAQENDDKRERARRFDGGTP